MASDPTSSDGAAYVFATLRSAAAALAALASLTVDDLADLRQVVDGLEADYSRLAAPVSPTELATVSGSSLRRASRTARLGAAMVASPGLADAVRDGRIGLEQAEVLAPVVEHPRFESVADEFFAIAERLDPRRLKAEVDEWTAVVDSDRFANRAARQRRLRSLVFGVDDDGMTTVRGRFTPEDGAVIKRSLGHLVRRDRDDTTGRPYEQRTADALVELCAAYAAGQVPGGREGPQLLVTIDADVLAGRTAGVGRLDTGEVVPDETVRRLACAASISPVLHRTNGEVLNVGRLERTATPAQYRALVVRDRGCVVPGCDRPPGWCQAHHIAWWDEHNGATDLENLALVCHRHHHLIHDDGWQLTNHPTAHGLRWTLTPLRDGAEGDGAEGDAARRQPTKRAA
jgi:hypothetical protein